MKLTVLVDNNTFVDRYFLAEPAAAYHIETEQTRLLFDTGYSEVTLRNAAHMGIDLRAVDLVVLSHGHSDHTGGIEPLVRLMSYEPPPSGTSRRGAPRLLAHPAALEPKWKQRDSAPRAHSIGASVSEDYVRRAFELQLSREPVWIDERLVFLGEIERSISFERPPAIGFRADSAEGSVPDYVPDDTALAYVRDDGIVVISGCSHSGICNIVQTAQKVTGVERVVDVVGGFHLQSPPPEQLEGTVAFIRDLNLPALHACHCTDLQSKIALAGAAPLKEVGCGLQLEY